MVLRSSGSIQGSFVRPVSTFAGRAVCAVVMLVLASVAAPQRASAEDEMVLKPPTTGLHIQLAMTAAPTYLYSGYGHYIALAVIPEFRIAYDFIVKNRVPFFAFASVGWTGLSAMVSGEGPSAESEAKIDVQDISQTELIVMGGLGVDFGPRQLASDSSVTSGMLRISIAAGWANMQTSEKFFDYGFALYVGFTVTALDFFISFHDDEAPAPRREDVVPSPPDRGEDADPSEGEGSENDR